MESLTFTVNDSAKKSDISVTSVGAVRVGGASQRRNSGDAVPLFTGPHLPLRVSAGEAASASASGSGSREGTPHLSCDFAPTTPLLAKTQRSPHYLPQLSFAEETRTSPLLPPHTDAKTKAASTALSTHVVRRLCPLSPLALPAPSSSSSSSSPVCATAAIGTAGGSTSAESGVATVATSPGICTTEQQRHYSAGNAYATHRSFGGGDDGALPQAVPSKVTRFEQRRIPPPPPATPAGGLADTSSNVNKGATAATATTAIAVTKAELKQVVVDGAPCLDAPRNSPSPSGLWTCRPASSVASPCARSTDHPSNDPHSPITPAVCVTASIPVAAKEREESTAGACGVRALTPPRRPTVAQRVPPSVPPLPSPLAVLEAADRETAQRVPGLSYRRCCGRHRQRLLGTGGVKELRYDVQPVTVHPSRPSCMLGGESSNSDATCNHSGGGSSSSSPFVHRDRGDEEDVRNGGSSAPRETLNNVTKTHIAAEAMTVVTPPSSSSLKVAAEGVCDVDAGTLLRPPQDRSLQSQASPPPLRCVSSRSHVSLVSRCSTPENILMDGGSAVVRRGDASPKPHSSGGALLRRSLPSERLFARPSSTSLTTDGHREGSGWSRSDAGTWGGSGRCLNLSTLTISCAPALDSFSTNSDSSLYP